jgi:lipopolysaccharide export system permease protein
MRWPRILSRYIAREVVQYTLLGLAAITFVFVSRSLLRFLDDLISVGFDAAISWSMLRCVVAMLIGYTLPVAFLFGVLLAIGRMASNCEITAMRAGGIGLRGIVGPLVALGIGVSCITWYIANDLEHAAQRELRVLIKRMASQAAMIEPGQFRRFGERVLYVRALDPESRLEGVMISDRSDPRRPLMIFAEYGQLDLDPDRGSVHLRLRNGSIHVEPEGEREESYRRISFLNFDYGFELQQVHDIDPARVRPAEMSMHELRAALEEARAGGSLERYREKNPAEYELQVHRRLALPLAPVLFSLVGAPLALRGRRRGARSLGAFFCTLIAFAYYAILTFSQYLALQGWLPAIAALWLPNATFAVVAALLLRRARGFEA